MCVKRPARRLPGVPDCPASDWKKSSDLSGSGAVRRSRERGVILVHVALTLVVVMGFTTFVVDQGVMWVSRRQAQNAADAGALAGAVARAYDEPESSPPSNGKAATAAHSVAQANMVWLEPPATVVSWACPGGASGKCVRVEVYRNGANGSTALPAFFGALIGADEQGVRATATAVAAVGNTTHCMRPWGVADKWIENLAPADQYNRWTKHGSTLVELSNPDRYVPASASGAGTGFRLPDDYGAEVVLKYGNPNSDNDPIEPGWFLPLRLPNGTGGYTSGADAYRSAIASCTGQPVKIGDYLPTETGGMVGPTGQGFDLLKAKDPLATWNLTTETVDNSCAPSCAPFSPRIVPLVIFDIDEYQQRRITNDWSVCPTGGKCVRVVNILGFFVSHMQGNQVVGYLMIYSGTLTTGSPSVGAEAGFLASVQLIR